MLYFYAILILGVLCSGAGGELFVRGTIGLARWFRISPGIIGVTVAAFATSSPELSVSIQAARADQPQISLGDALGSNVVNVALILGISLALSGIKVSRDTLKRDYPVALAVPIVITLLFLDGVLSRWDGFLLLALFLTWMALAISEVRKQRSFTGQVLATRGHWWAVLSCLGGLLLLVAAGGFIVTGARGIAHSYGMKEFVIGATVVAIGTSVPELATTLIAKYRKHDEVGLGTVLGSNIFNGLFIISIAAMICPIRLAWQEAALASGFSLITLAVAFPARNGWISRKQGFLLLAIYAVYVFVILSTSNNS